MKFSDPPLLRTITDDGVILYIHELDDFKEHYVVVIQDGNREARLSSELNKNQLLKYLVEKHKVDSNILTGII